MILLSFDIEEFDAPQEYGAELSFERQIELSTIGLERILNLLEQKQIKATFFITANFALNNAEIMKRIVSAGHEIASHGFYHSKKSDGDLVKAAAELEKIAGKKIAGYRTPRMGDVSIKELKDAGHTYNSSLNPTFLPGRYNNLNMPRNLFYEDGITQLPASVSRFLRLPLFWLALHNMPLPLYKWLCAGAVKKDGYLNVYFHPWEFCDALHEPELKMPYIIRHNSGMAHVERLASLIDYLRSKGYQFYSISEFLDSHKNNE